MDESVIAIIIASLAALGSVLPYFRKRLDSDSEVAKASEVLVKPLREELVALREDYAALRDENDDLRKQLERLLRE